MKAALQEARISIDEALQEAGGNEQEPDGDTDDAWS
jgi:hypothetical protein